MLRASAGMPLAAGENIASREGFEQVLAEDVLGVVQPDIAKWGGLTVCAGLARDILKAGKTFCPHYLGGGIGLLASAHLLAGIGGDGWLEVDANDNLLRDQFCGPVLDVNEGTIVLDDAPGLGISARAVPYRPVPQHIDESEFDGLPVMRVGPISTIGGAARIVKPFTGPRPMSFLPFPGQLAIG